MVIAWFLVLDFKNLCWILSIIPWLIWGIWEFLFWCLGVWYVDWFGCYRFDILDALDFIVLQLEWTEPHRHTAGWLISDIRCWVILVLSHGTICEEYVKLSLGLEEFCTGWTLARQAARLNDQMATCVKVHYSTVGQPVWVLRRMI